MSNNGQDAIADYIIGTFYRFEHVETALLGEFEDRRRWPDSRLFAVIRIGDVGRKAVLVTVSKNDKGEQAGFVVVKFEWLNTSAGDGTVLRGAETHAIDCNIPDEQIEDAKHPCTNIIERSLAIYRDVLEGTGVAGKISDAIEEDMDEFEDEFEDEMEAPDENQVW